MNSVTICNLIWQFDLKHLPLRRNFKIFIKQNNFNNMRKIMKSFALLSATILFFACNKEIIQPFEQKLPSDMASTFATKSPIVSMEDAYKIAQTISSDVLSAPATKSDNRTIKEVIPVTDNRNSKVNSFYVVNYENNKGFVLISGTRNYYPILANSDEGNFSFDDYMPYGITMWMNGIKSIIKEQMEQTCIDSLVGFRKAWELFERTYTPLTTIMGTIPTTKRGDPLDDMIQNKKAEWSSQGIGYYNPLWGYGSGFTSPPSDEFDGLCQMAMNHVYGQYPFRVEPFIIEIQPTPSYATKNSLMSTLWKQAAPYNKAVSGDYAGCAAVAMAQVMKFYAHPNPVSTPNGSVNFNNMANSYSSSPINSSSDDVAYLMHDIGHGVNMQYWPTGSFPLDFLTGDPIGNALKNRYSYSNTITRSDYNYSGVKGQLILNRPVIMYGFEGTLSFWTGHVWVADGYTEADFRSEYYLVYFQDTPSYGPHMTSPYLAHIQQNLYFKKLYINWGWGGSYNGFYDSTGFKPDTNNYHSGLKMYLNVIPQ